MTTQTTRIVVGLTKSDLPAYSSYDGWKAGARQETVEVTVPLALTEVVGVKTVAESVFEATNMPVLANPQTLTGALQDALLGKRYRSVSVGDTVTVFRDDGVESVSCERWGWEVIDPTEVALPEETR